jgi:hypothetical protein
MLRRTVYGCGAAQCWCVLGGGALRAAPVLRRSGAGSIQARSWCGGLAQRRGAPPGEKLLLLREGFAAVRPGPRRRRDNLRGCILDDADSSLERVDPPVEPASLAGEDGWIAEGVGEQCTALIGSEKAHGEVVRVASAQCPELLLCPLDRNAH